ncbi:hypothetical protein T484DRAFT_3434225 [Baffinella frigidus]|nr:hypothetical protein T484DRAFT_3434225 [Cryptophyta sp. CCMP2293]
MVLDKWFQGPRPIRTSGQWLQCAATGTIAVLLESPRGSFKKFATLWSKSLHVLGQYIGQKLHHICQYIGRAQPMYWLKSANILAERSRGRDVQTFPGSEAGPPFCRRIRPRIYGCQRVWGFEMLSEGLGFRNSQRVWGFEMGVSGWGFGGWDFGFWVWGLRDQNFGVELWGVGGGVWGWGFGVGWWGFGVRGLGFGSRVSGCGFEM